jgi:hypothetical protein
MVETKTLLLFGAVAVLTGCFSDGAQQRQSNAAIEQIKEQRGACYADAALAIDDGVSDAETIGEAVSWHCRKYTEEPIRLASSDGHMPPAQFSGTLMMWPQRMLSSSAH